MKKLYKSNTDKKIAGVCGGIGEYFEIDPTFVRIITMVLFLSGGIGLLAYLVCWMVMPNKPFDSVD